MSIFKRLSELLGEGYSLNLTIQMKGNKMSVTSLPKSIMPNPGPAMKNMQPIVVTGTPDELDIGFLAAIAQPLAGVNKLIVSGDSFVKKEKGTAKKTEEKPAEKPAEPSLDLKAKEPMTEKQIEAEGKDEPPVPAPPDEPVVAEAAPAPAPAPTAAPAPAPEPSGDDFDEIMGDDEGW